jgi:NitT/TauT family transport system permease protein
LGWYIKVGATFSPLIEVFRTISPISWIPLAILWFGIGDIPAVFIIFISSFFPILIATIHAGKNIDPVLLRVAANFGAQGPKLFRHVIFPASFPYIVVGLRISLGISWLVVVAAEMVGLRSGLGYLIMDARNFLRTDFVIAGMVTIGIVGYTLDRVMRSLETRFEKHKTRHKNVPDADGRL